MSAQLFYYGREKKRAKKALSIQTNHIYNDDRRGNNNNKKDSKTKFMKKKDDVT